MAWVDSLTEADVAELREIGRRIGPTALEPYIVIAMAVRIYGPLPLQDFDAYMVHCDELSRVRVAAMFYLDPDRCVRLGSGGAIALADHREFVERQGTPS